VRTYSAADDKKLTFLCRAVVLMNSKPNSRIYSINDLTLAFTWYAKSRALYTLLRDHLQLPSVSTLRRITGISKNVQDSDVFMKFFNSADLRSRGCILISDEIYVKSSITYRGGYLYGDSVDEPGKAATTLLCIMVKCFFGGKTFLAKLVPCHALKADFQYKVVCDVVSQLETCGAKVYALINDNNRLNQRFFSMFTPHEASKPWIVKSPADPESQLFLIYDPVHLLKNIGNDWLTEKTQSLQYREGSVTQTARWADLTSLYKHDSAQVIKLSQLSKAAVQPSNIQKQNASLALKVFSERTKCCSQKFGRQHRFVKRNCSVHRPRATSLENIQHEMSFPRSSSQRSYESRHF